MDLPVSRPRMWKNKSDFFRPFRTAAAVEAASSGENIAPLYDPALHRQIEDSEPDLRHLNASLMALVDIFPDVEPEVFREMLLGISEESRLQVVTEHLLTKKAKWIRGRYRAPPTPAEGDRQLRRQRDEDGGRARTPSMMPHDEWNIEPEELFRSDDYKKAVRQVLYLEFKNLSHSAIKAVLAEQNFSYTLARPVLQHLSSKSWRFSLSSLWSRKCSGAAAGDHPFISWLPPAPSDGSERWAAKGIPAVRRTGSAQLDHELYELFAAPVLTAISQAQVARDRQLAAELNEEEAEQAEALFECECCYGSVVFEQIATCDDGCHQLCLDCVRRTVSEALYGQGWARAVDLETSSVRCFAPVTTEECRGIVSPSVVRRALSAGGENEDAWNEFQLRAAADALLKSRLPLQRCPFCNYAEVDETPPLSYRGRKAVVHHVATRTPEPVQIILLILLAMSFILTIPILLTLVTLWLAVQVYPPATAALSRSWSRVYKRRRGLKFRCQNPTCLRPSCMRCLARWRDPHGCFENEKTSLRTAIEASATAAVKRTCPKCLLSFVKSSGCNKLVCNCGYTMCYICRQEITSKEGYAHFCQHFRPHGGRCTDCERCDLYGDEDEEAAIRTAAAEAERAWKEKEGGGEGGDASRPATEAMVEALVGQNARGFNTWERWMDVVVDAVAA